jgi:hypothetical protein
MLGQRNNARHVLHRQHFAVGQLTGPRPEHGGMGIKRDASLAIAYADEVERAQHAAGMVPVSVRQHDRLDRGEIQRQAISVALERVGLGPGVEQHDVTLRAAPRRDQA